MTGTPISSIRNLGPAVEGACARAGIPDAETLRELGAHEAYARMLAAGTRPHFVGYFVLHMALQGRPWNDCVGKEKETLRRRFDSLKQGARQAAPGGALPPGLETILDQIGVRAPG